MYNVEITKQFEKDILLAVKQKKDMEALAFVLNILENEQKIPKKYQNHKLKNVKPVIWDLHIQPDWLLLYTKDNENQTIKLVRIGSHAELF